MAEMFSKTFQSTLPMKGATIVCPAVGVPVIVSIHAPNEGSDQLTDMATRGLPFQSTLPMKGATHLVQHRQRIETVSIHAPNEWRDYMPELRTHLAVGYNPLS